ncbi:hypothetical protein GDO86_009837 [Hymenochirus boettgeri]|uniref:RWD domain-containing protein n=1 Tax=Hymenochirus boettgeri TaxID=247094 RepID=A0A8T2JQJ9_9PIPI|nr:hypothetical protein GDO86_009837 [Hymenochirus boettgeri]
MNLSSILHIKRYLKGIRESIPPIIEFSIFVQINETGFSESSILVKAEMHVSLPHRYPEKEPQLFVQSVALDQQQQSLVNKHLASYIFSLDCGQLCITMAVQWLQDISCYINNVNQPQEPDCEMKETTVVFHRMWIYSHHIYRQELKKKIFDFAKRLNLTGLCLTGKPGVICIIEGMKEQSGLFNKKLLLNLPECEEFWRDICYPNWKHISCKHTESKEVTAKIDNLRLFHTFEDLIFTAQVHK